MKPESTTTSPHPAMPLWIRWRRRAKGWNLKELAAQVGHVTVATLSNIETGRHVPRPDLAQRLGEVLGGRSAARTARALRAWAELAHPGAGPAREAGHREALRAQVAEFLDQEREADPESVLPLGGVVSAPRPGRGYKAPVSPHERTLGDEVSVRELSRHLKRLPVFREEDDPGDPRLGEPEPIAHRYVDVRSFGDEIDMRYAYLVRLSRRTALRLGAPFGAGDLAVLSREGVPGEKSEIFHVPDDAGGHMLAKVMKRDGQLIVQGSESEGVLRVEPWPRDLSRAARRVPARVIGVMHRHGF